MDKIENKESEYAYKSEIKIEQGFYKGRYGLIIGMNTEKTGQITYDVQIKDQESRKIIVCRPEQIRKIKKLW